ncbi:MAG: hypothetical protein ACOC1F_08755, partial [Myxococcota bacterium]
MTRCRDTGAVVTFAQADFCQLERNERVVAAAVSQLGRVDVALIAHGDLGDQLASESAFDEAERILRVNFTSVVSLLVPREAFLKRHPRSPLAPRVRQAVPAGSVPLHRPAASRSPTTAKATWRSRGLPPTASRSGLAPSVTRVSRKLFRSRLTRTTTCTWRAASRGRSCPAPTCGNRTHLLMIPATNRTHPLRSYRSNSSKLSQHHFASASPTSTGPRSGNADWIWTCFRARSAKNRMTVLSAITQADVANKILDHLTIPTHPEQLGDRLPDGVDVTGQSV